MDLKIHRKNENKLHEHLYNNLYLLSQFYPTSTDFNCIFKKDMFIRSNKAAFFEVIYYLLSILTPEEIKEKLTMWPPYEIKRENKFRTEVLTYVNELNILYDYADIPHIMQSHLISPGGFKFTKFMLKLSELVVFEHLKKYNKVELHCPIQSENFVFHTAYFKKQTTSINFKSNEKIQKFNSYYTEEKIKAGKILHNLTKINNTIVEEKRKNVITEDKFKKQYPLYPSLETLDEKIKFLNKEWYSFQPVHELFNLCGSLIKRLSSDRVLLEHNKEQFKIPNEIIHIIKSKEELDLIDFFQGLNILLEHQALDLPNIPNCFVNPNIQKINKLRFRHMEISDILTERKQEIQKSLNEFLDRIKVLEDSNDDMQITVLVHDPY